MCLRITTPTSPTQLIITIYFHQHSATLTHIIDAVHNFNFLSMMHRVQFTHRQGACEGFRHTETPFEQERL
jgi:hypothetical protein